MAKPKMDVVQTPLTPQMTPATMSVASTPTPGQTQSQQQMLQQQPPPQGYGQQPPPIMHIEVTPPPQQQPQPRKIMTALEGLGNMI